MTIVAAPLWPGPAGRLRNVTLNTLPEVTASFTVADWARLEDEHLDIVGLRMFGELEEIGIDMDDDPVAVFCILYLGAREARRAAAQHPAVVR